MREEGDSEKEGGCLSLALDLLESCRLHHALNSLKPSCLHLALNLLESCHLAVL